jgi:hypothetical protein
MGNDEVAGNQEIILKMAGAGISLTLYGLSLGNDKWKFLLDKDEGTMADFLLEEDADILPMLRTESEYVDTWDKALALIDTPGQALSQRRCTLSLRIWCCQPCNLESQPGQSN